MLLRSFWLSVLIFTYGCVYANIKVPLDTDVNNTQLGEKVGIASSHSVAWLVAWGDAGTHAAAKQGEISNIKHLDQSFYSVLFGLYSKRSTIAYGD